MAGRYGAVVRFRAAAAPRCPLLSACWRPRSALRPVTASCAYPSRPSGRLRVPSLRPCRGVFRRRVCDGFRRGRVIGDRLRRPHHRLPRCAVRLGRRVRATGGSAPSPAAPAAPTRSSMPRRPTQGRSPNQTPARRRPPSQSPRRSMCPRFQWLSGGGRGALGFGCSTRAGSARRAGSPLGTRGSGIVGPRQPRCGRNRHSHTQRHR